MGPCRCLCIINHTKHSGLCTGVATKTVRFSQFSLDSPLAKLDHVDVKLCEPCSIATIAQRMEKKPVHQKGK